MNPFLMNVQIMILTRTTNKLMNNKYINKNTFPQYICNRNKFDFS